jgi:long-chain acyl-CoA synthetase
MPADPLCERVGDLAAAWAAVRPEAPALIFEGRVTTWAQLDLASRKVAAALVAAGLEPGSRVALLGPDDDQVWQLVLGCALAGCVVLGVNPRLAPPEIAFILEDGEAAALFVHPSELPGLDEVLPGLGLVLAMAPGDHGLPLFADWRDAAPEHTPLPDVDPEDVFAQMYTSGTTGLPKGVMLAHRSFFAVLRSLREAGDDWIGWSPDDVSLDVIPSFHIGGLWWALTGMGAGACNVVSAGWRPDEALRLLAEQRVTKVCMVPAMIAMLLDEPACLTADTSALEHVVYGGSPIPRPLLERAMAVLGCRFAQIYGLTETGNTAVCLRHEDHVDPDGTRLAAAGRPYPGVRLRIVGAEGQDLPAGEVGEVWIHSPANMLGYWKRAEATQQTLVDGWVVSGDLGWLDDTDCLTICDRKKDMIISAGENVFPAEIESVLAGHPDVAESAVIGVPDERWGESVLALVVARPDTRPDPGALIAHCRASLADFKVPRRVEFRDALPRTPSGKLKKAELRGPFWEGRERQVN